MQQTAKEFAKVKAMQTKQKNEDKDTMEKAAEAIESDQEKMDARSNMTEITFSICFTGLDQSDWRKNEEDNDFLFKTFIVKWVGIDPTKLKIHPKPLGTTCGAQKTGGGGQEEEAEEQAVSTFLEAAVIQRSSLRSGLRSRELRSRASPLPLSPSSSSNKFLSFFITVDVPTDRKDDIISVEKAVNKLVNKEEGAESVNAMNDVVREVGATTGWSCQMHKKIFVREDGSTPPEMRTNATEVEEAAESGDLNSIASVVNATDTPDIAEAVEAQKLEAIATSDGPLKVLPDQAIPGPSFPGAYGTDLARR